MSKLIDVVRNIAALDDSVLQSHDVYMLQQTLDLYRSSARSAVEDLHDFTVTRAGSAFLCAICDKPRSDHYFAA